MTDNRNAPLPSLCNVAEKALQDLQRAAEHQGDGWTADKAAALLEALQFIAGKVS